MSIGFLRFSTDFPIILPFPGISDLSSPPSRFAANSYVALEHHPVHWSAPPSPPSLRAWLYSSLVWPPCLQMGMEFEWPSWKRMGPISLFPVTILGPDPANHLALEESNLPDATPSFPQNLQCLNQPGFSFFPLLCQIFALHLGKPIIQNLPKVLYFLPHGLLLFSQKLHCIFLRRISLTKQRDSFNSKVWTWVFYWAGSQSSQFLSLCPENMRNWQMSFWSESWLAWNSALNEALSIFRLVANFDICLCCILSCLL